MSMIAWYKLNGDAADASGNGRHGAPTDVSWVVGKVGNAASFNGSTSKIACPDQILPPGTGPWSIALWVKANSIAANKGLFSNSASGTAANIRVTLVFSAAGQLRLNLGDGTYYDDIRSTNGDTFVGEWNHVAVTRAANGYVSFYRNGAAYGGSASARNVPASAAAEIGRAYYNNSFILDGLIDDLRIYDEVLSAGQIAAIINNITYRCEAAQAAVSGSTAGCGFHTGAMAGCDFHGGAVAGQLV